MGDIIRLRCQVSHDLLALPVTLDIWTDNVQIPYLGFTIHYIDNNWIYYSRRVALSPLEENEKDAINIKTHWCRILAQTYNVRLHEARFICTTDSGSNVINIFNALRCNCHRLSTIMGDVFDHPLSEVKAKAGTVTNVILFCKKLVELAKRTGKNAYLPSALVQACTTRWTHNYFTLKSIHKNRAAIEKWLEELDNEDTMMLLDEINSFNGDLLESLIEYFGIMKTAIDCLQVTINIFISKAQHSPTIHLVWFFDVWIKKKLAGMQYEKAGTIKRLRQKLVLEDWHYWARFLHPLSKSLKDEKVDIPQKASVLSKMKEFMKVVLSDKEERPLEIAAEEPVEDPVQNTRDADQSFGFMTVTENEFEIESDAPSIDQMIEDELDRYQVRNMGKDLKRTELFDFPSRQSKDPSMQYVYFNVMKWWKENEKDFPRLATVAKYILAVQASSAESERLFSFTGCTKTKFRAAMAVQTLTALSINNGNPDLFDQELKALVEEIKQTEAREKERM
ncbi:Ribonuclease H-like domain-containing protein [Rozella allomycis CSF55]|uniref:Ribonuclease H-like domain-containing protein n=1 Tax=Rozella allomycis (strain CSF55) TaxID=988480 RepID=A0A075AW86_ROZAC|nr:Ribonuclease H-like domain-containing protein [Rozella allomycis CSF55]|eukprot:EPZ34515.1 Ribonuclease H-like domain-containing protein [Rozella allomycis CSF55]